MSSLENYMNSSNKQAIPAITTFVNPVVDPGADPFVLLHEGYYYFLRTEVKEIVLYKCRHLYRLSHYDDRKTVYSGSDSRFTDNIWASEIHKHEDRWYIYASGTKEKGSLDFDVCDIQMFCLESVGSDPMGEYRFKASMPVKENGILRNAIDPTILHFGKEHKEHYLLYSLYTKSKGQCIAISNMINPWTLGNKHGIISSPIDGGYPWEHKGWYVNEGPAVLEKNGKIYIAYSASGFSTGYYCLGLLTFTGTSENDLFMKEKWKKSSEPIFQCSEEKVVFSPGHNVFVESPDHTEIWNVYHAQCTQSQKNPQRSVRIQRVEWKGEDGDIPDLGVPVKVGEELPIPSEVSYEYKEITADTVQRSF